MYTEYVVGKITLTYDIPPQMYFTDTLNMLIVACMAVWVVKLCSFPVLSFLLFFRLCISTDGN